MSRCILSLAAGSVVTSCSPEMISVGTAIVGSTCEPSQFTIPKTWPEFPTLSRAFASLARRSETD